ncbi:MAG: LytTR family DNA-binding domain-containing protein [Spirosomataceae bacterium]
METEILIGARKKVNPSEILSLKGDVNYTTVFFTDGQRKEVVATTLKKIQNRLHPFPHFFRISKNTIINLNCIEAVEDGNVIMFTGDKEHTSRRRRKAFLEFSESLKLSQMKKIIFFLFISLNFAHAQNFIHGSYIVDATPYFAADAGTNSYTYSVPALPIYGCGNFWNYKIYRYDGYWYCTETSYCGSYLRHRTVNRILTPNPPCSENWYNANATWLPSLPVTSPNHPAIPPSATSALYTFSNPSCSTLLSVLSGTVTPYYFLPPSLTTTDILAIVSPQTGALVWDITAMCLKVYNGTAWVCL